MLQRAASNAYSWWWASHIRTKQSKWLEQNLMEMEEKVHDTLELLSSEGDSFAKRAEMYYKKRPELISFVEEAFRAYRALAERYDHISTELQTANTKIATMFPDEVPFDMEDDDDSPPSKFPKKMPPGGAKANIPGIPKLPIKNLKGMLTTATKKLQQKKSVKGMSHMPPKSGLSKSEATVEIDKLQKDILAMQTEKEFVKSSYESGVARFWEIEKTIKEKQEKICVLQNEFGTGIVIEDDEARRLMAATAIKSCQEKLVELQEKHELTVEETKVEQQRVKDSKERLQTLQNQFLGAENSQQELVKDESAESEKESESETNKEQKKEIEALGEKIKENFDVGADASLNVTDMAEKINELVNKVINFESAVSSQTALIQSLRTENNDLQSQIKALEDDKMSLMGDKTDLKNKIKEMEEKLQGMKELECNVKDQSGNLETHFTEACSNLGQISENLQGGKQDRENTSGSLGMDNSNRSGETQDEKEPDSVNAAEDKLVKASGSIQKDEQDDKVVVPEDKEEDTDNPKDTNIKKETNPFADASQSQANVDEDEPDWKQLFCSNLEDRERTLLAEYTTVLRNYKEVKKRLTDMEKTLQSSDAKDEEIRLLSQKLEKGNNDLEEAIRAKHQRQQSLIPGRQLSKDNEDEISTMMMVDRSDTTSPVEDEFRMNIDELLEENLDFWLRFSTSFHEIQKFDSSIQDLQGDILKLAEKKKQEGSSTGKYASRSDARALYTHLKEIHTELTVWLEKCILLKGELKSRFSSLCNIQDEITQALKASAEDDDFKFTSYQAAKFQGEILNMKQENNKVADELQAGLDHVTTLQLEAEKTLSKMSDEYGLSGTKQNMQLPHSDSKSRVPLRSFIFGVKQKNKKPSIFSCMNPAMYKKIRANAEVK